VVELGNGRLVVREGKGSAAASSSPAPPVSPAPPLQPAAKASAQTPAAPAKEKNFWDEYADMTLGRYFLLIAWMALYLALENAQQARAAERREGEYRRAAQAAELRSLRYQINPHFLFNTLNSLSALVLTGKPAEAERMIQTIATFYRRSLAGDPTGDLALAQEIKLQKLYLEIEAVRFPERLRTVFDVPEDLADVLVPGMILQPLVENSIKYAVAATTRPVTVTIAARAEAGRLVLSVADDGPGAGIGQDGCGIGLANVRDRLHARFDGAASLDAGPAPEGGFRTVIRLPLEHRDD
jgi:two-component system, LytTR family, sensor kinase